MSDPLVWELSFAAQLAGLKEASSEIQKFTQQLKDANVQLQALSASEKKEGDAAKESKKSHEGMWQEIMKGDLAAEYIQKVTDKLVEMGVELGKWAIEAMDADYKAVVAMTHMSGSADVAKDIIQRSRAFALGTSEDLEKVEVAFQRLAATGLRGEMLTSTMAAAKDLAIVSSRSFDQTTAFFQILGSDRGLNGTVVRQLSEFPGLLKLLERDMGNLTFEELKKHLAEAPLRGVEAMNLLQKEIMELAHEDKLGNAAVEFGTTIGGSFQKIKDSFGIMLSDMSESPEFEHLRKTLNLVAEWWNPASASGKKMEHIIHDAFEPILNLIDQIAKNPDQLKHYFDSAISAVDHLAHAIEPFVKVGDWLFGGHAGESLGNYPAQGTAERAALDKQDSDKFDRLYSISHLFSSHTGGGGGIKHPEELADSIGIEKFAGGGDVYHPTIALVGEDEPERIGPIPGAGESGSGGSGHVFHINIPVQVLGHGGEDGDEQSLENQLNSFLPGMLINALEQASQQMGGR